MKNRLLPLEEKSPRKFYRVIDTPALLAGMPIPPGDMDWKALADKGIKYVVSLESESPLYDPSPLKLLYATKLNDLVLGNPPNDPKGEELLIRKAVTLITAKLKAGEGVVVHCWGGTGRTGTVIGCVLKELGYEGREIVRYMDLLHKQRGREGWPEASWQAQLVERF